MEEKEKKEMLKAFYEITAAESPKDMYYIAVDMLRKYDMEPAPHN